MRSEEKSRKYEWIEWAYYPLQGEELLNIEKEIEKFENYYDEDCQLKLEYKELDGIEENIYVLYGVIYKKIWK